MFVWNLEMCPVIQIAECPIRIPFLQSVSKYPTNSAPNKSDMRADGVRVIGREMEVLWLEWHLMPKDIF